jgi:hypothetical protein
MTNSGDRWPAGGQEGNALSGLSGREHYDT